MTASTGMVTHEARPWHLSASLAIADGTETPAQFEVEPHGAPSDAGERQHGRAAHDTHAPLWLRIVTGQPVAWRVRRMRRRLRRVRRGAARRALRWLQLHPELRYAASSGTLHQLVGGATRHWIRRRRSPFESYRSPVIVEAALTVRAPASSTLFDGVRVHHQPGAAASTIELSETRDGSISVRGPLGDIPDILGPVDLKRWNPSTFQWNPTGASWIPLQAVIAAGTSHRHRLAFAQRVGAVVCDPSHSHPSSVRGRVIVELACAGVPLVGQIADAEVALVGTDLAETIAAASADDCADDQFRQLHSLRLRRAALGQHSPRGWWSTVVPRVGARVNTTPSVSVLLPSNRPGDVVEAARSVARQIGVEIELVVGLHGSHMPSDLEERLGGVFAGNLVVRRCDDSLNLGQVLNDLTSVASCDLVSKWDDDDWYEQQHLADLVRALEYSGAGLVGKAAEFIYLEALDLTVRRFATGSERWSTTIAGGTLLLPRRDLIETGWAEVPRQVDRHLIAALLAERRKIYRLHGFGYVLRRRSADLAGHTWAAGDEYFLRQASAQREGLDLEFAGFEVEA